MKTTALHPELRSTYKWVPPIPFHNRFFYGLISRLQGLRSRKIKPAEGVDIVDHPLSCGAVRIYRPQRNANGAGLLWIHGGGYIIGDVSINDADCIAFARDMGLVVVSVDYRLAPRHPFPAALDDCFEAWQYLQASAAELSIDRARVAVAGQSAGGGLAAAVVQRVADAGGIQPAAQVLIYPMLDDRTAANTTLDAIGHKLWNNRNNRGGWSWYLSQPPGQQPVPPYAVPARRESLAGLPPAWVGVGDLDLFCREDGEYAERLRAADVPCELHVAPQAPHAFEMLVPNATISKAFTADYHSFLRKHLRL